MANIIKQLPSKSEEILLLAYRDLIAFGKLFMPGDFMKSPTPPFHYEIGDELISDSNKPCAIIIPRGHAKTSISLEETIVCESGPKKVKDVLIGDSVYGSDGQLKEIVGLSDIELRESYKITMADGREIIVSDDHIFTVRDQCPQAVDKCHYHDMCAEEIYATFKRKAGKYYRNRWSIDNHAPLEYPEKKYNIDPYLIGLVIGDGSVTSPTGFTVLHGHIDDLAEYQEYINEKTSIRPPSKNKSPWNRQLSIYGVGPRMLENDMRYSCKDKRIPDHYKYGSISQRKELLAGLMDTDGSTASGVTYYCTISPALAKDVTDLVRSLGGNAKCTFRENDYSGFYDIQIRTSFCPFRLNRKKDAWFAPKRDFYTSIVDVTPAGKKFCRCIEVDSEDHLFVAGDYILTHNTLVKGSIVRDFCFQHFAKQWGLTEEDPMNLFYGWVSSNQKKSKNNVSYVRMHLKHNEKLHYYFGSQLGNFRVDNQEDIVTGYGDRLLSSSNLTSMRGDTLATIEKGALRYSRVFIDDAENEENTRTQNARDKIKDNIMNGIYPAIEKKKPGCRLFLIETPVHFDAFAQNILDKWAQVQKAGPEAIEEFAWKVISHKATQPDGSVLWPGYMSREVLDNIKQTYADSPRGIAGYYQEYELEVQNYETALWNRKHIKYHKGSYRNEDGQNILLIDGERVPVNTFIGCDPATDIETKNSDYSVIMAIAVDRENNVYVLEYERHRNIPTKGIERGDGTVDGKLGVVDYILDLYKKYNCKQGTVEDVAMNRTIFQTLNEVRRSRNVWDMVITPEKPGGRDKLNRIYSGLGSRFSAGAIYVRDSHFDLIDEILKFGPKMAHDDTIEALYYACKYAHPPRGLVKDAETAKYTKAKRKPKSWIVA